MPLFRKPDEFEFPGPTDRVAIVGATGEGKSTFAFYLFAVSADFDKKPWFLVDYKGEVIIKKLLAERDATLISLEKPPPKKPGIYVVKPDPEKPSEMASWLWKVYRAGNAGLFFDELSMVPEFKGAAGGGGPLKSILTQGRSKNIPVYGLVQRPVDVNLHTFSEANFIGEFYLKKTADRDRVREYIPDGDPIFYDDKPLPRYWSRWWDDKRRKSYILRPAPPETQILDTIAARVYRIERHRSL